MMISKNRPEARCFPGGSYFAGARGIRDLRHVGCGVVADDVIDESDLA